MRLNFEFGDASAFGLHLPIFNPLLELLFLCKYVLANVGIDVLDLQFCLLEYFLHFGIIGLIEENLSFMFIFPCL